MKTNLLSLSLAALLFSAPLSAAHAQTTGKPSLPIKTLHAIQENVQAAQQNAHIYQWVRVNQEVDRVVADAHKVEKALAGNSALAQQGTELSEAVKALRSARLANNVEGIAAAAQKLNAVCNTLLTK